MLFLFQNDKIRKQKNKRDNKRKNKIINNNKLLQMFQNENK